MGRPYVDLSSADGYERLCCRACCAHLTDMSYLVHTYESTYGYMMVFANMTNGTIRACDELRYALCANRLVKIVVSTDDAMSRMSTVACPVCETVVGYHGNPERFAGSVLDYRFMILADRIDLR